MKCQNLSSEKNKKLCPDHMVQNVKMSEGTFSHIMIMMTVIMIYQIMNLLFA